MPSEARKSGKAGPKAAEDSEPPAGQADEETSPEETWLEETWLEETLPGEIPPGETSPEEISPQGRERALPAQELRNARAHLAAAGVKGASSPQEYYKALSSKSAKRAFFEQFEVDKKRKFACQVVEKTEDAASDSVEVVEGWMSKPAP